MLLSHVTFIVMYFQNKTVFVGTSMSLLKYHFANYVSMENGDSVSLFTADMMQLFQCCGYSNSTDFGGSGAKFVKRDVYNGTVYEDLRNPLPCCKTTESGALFPSCPNRFDTQNSNIRNGCQKSFMALMEGWVDFFVYLSILALFINLLSMGPIITA
ncbi:hypothetical protein CRM22_007066 [Opisthorchis felineus]|uniref:Tetraspanin n=2 Tax=Opisthorchis felineus TaxID=147828 RepID=A0A4S2LPN2_OPIFE|nr:hypothetical protein CRM22_007066 [Opisthorchis felineus]